MTGDALETGAIVMVEGLPSGTPRTMKVQGVDHCGRWKLKLVGQPPGGKWEHLYRIPFGASVLVDSVPYWVVGGRDNQLRLRPVPSGYGREKAA